MSNITESVTDSISLSDSILLSVGYLFSDTVSLSDSPTVGPGYLFSDSVSLSDAAKDLVGLFVGANDQIGISDFVVLRKTPHLPPPPGPISDRGDASNPDVGDSLTLADSIQVFSPYSVALADSLSFSDSIGTSQTNFTDSLSLSDSISIGIGIIVSDGLTFSDAAAATLSNTFLALTVSVADSLSLFDSQQHASSVGVHVGDSLTFQDSAGVVLISNTTDYLRRYLNDVI